MNFNEAYSKIKTLVQPELQQVEELICPINSNSIEFDESLTNFLKAPSKRLRSTIAFLYIKSLGIMIDEKQIAIQSAIELVHNATLIHDDIIDNSDTRREQKSINAQFDNSLAVIAGDLLLSKALKQILSINNKDILDIFSTTIEKMCLGEVSQYFLKHKIPQLDVYINKSAQKTASLFEASLISSAIVGGFSKLSAEAFAKNFGIAFQIRDDILNFKTTKNDPKKNDFQNGIYTAPVILANDMNNISSGIEKSITLLDNYLSEAKNVISHFEENIYKKALIQLLDLLKI